MIKIDSFDIIYGSYKGTDVIYGSLDTPLILHLQKWYKDNWEFVEYDGTPVQVAFLNFVKYYINPQMDWKRESNTFKVIDNPSNSKYPRRNKGAGNRPRIPYNRK